MNDNIKNALDLMWEKITDFFLDELHYALTDCARDFSIDNNDCNNCSFYSVCYNFYNVEKGE